VRRDLERPGHRHRLARRTVRRGRRLPAVRQGPPQSAPARPGHRTAALRSTTVKVLVTGGDGQLGTELCLRLRAAGHDTIAFTHREADFTQPGTVRAAITAQRADWVINCAAHTAVDKAESEADLAYAINRDGAGALAEAVAGYGGRLI